MSLSNPKLTNPCKKFIEFKGDSGKFQYWDKEQEKNIELAMPFRFIFLDELNSVTGFNDSAQAGIYSNEVHNLNTQILTVRVFKSAVCIKGKYKDIKAEILQLGGKFMKSIYIGLLDAENNLELANLKLKGSGFGGWLDKKFNPEENPAVEVSETREDKKGAVKYHVPIFKNFDISSDILKDAISLDKQLQGYLKEYETITPEEPKEVPIAGEGTNFLKDPANIPQYPDRRDLGDADLPF